MTEKISSHALEILDIVDNAIEDVYHELDTIANMTTNERVASVIREVRDQYDIHGTGRFIKKITFQKAIEKATSTI